MLSGKPATISGCSADGSVLGSGPRGRGFKSRHSDHQQKRPALVVGLFCWRVESKRDLNPGGRERRENVRWTFEQRAVERDRKGSARSFSRGRGPGVNPATRTMVETSQSQRLRGFCLKFQRFQAFGPLHFITTLCINLRCFSSFCTSVLNKVLNGFYKNTLELSERFQVNL